MDIFVCLAFIPQKWALGSNTGTLAKVQKVNSEWEVKRWGCEQHKYSLALKPKRVTAAAVVQIDALGCKPSPTHPCSAAESLWPQPGHFATQIPWDQPGRCPLTADRSCAGLPFPALLQPDLGWVRNVHFWK